MDAPEPREDKKPVEESEASSRLDDFLDTAGPITGSEEEKKQPDPPAFDPFLEPSARDELLGEEPPVEKNRGGLAVPYRAFHRRKHLRKNSTS